MKKIFIFLFLGIAGFIANGQITTSELHEYLSDNGYSISVESYAYLSEGETANRYKTFHDGTDYVIIAYSESSAVSDVDVKLYSSGGTLLEEDTEVEAVAIVSYSPSYDRELKVVYKNYDSNSSSEDYKIKLCIAYK